MGSAYALVMDCDACKEAPRLDGVRRRAADGDASALSSVPADSVGGAACCGTDDEGAILAVSDPIAVDGCAGSPISVAAPWAPVSGTADASRLVSRVAVAVATESASVNTSAMSGSMALLSVKGADSALPLDCWPAAAASSAVDSLREAKGMSSEESGQYSASDRSTESAPTRSTLRMGTVATQYSADALWSCASCAAPQKLAKFGPTCDFRPSDLCDLLTRRAIRGVARVLDLLHRGCGYEMTSAESQSLAAKRSHFSAYKRQRCLACACALGVDSAFLHVTSLGPKSPVAESRVFPCRNEVVGVPRSGVWSIVYVPLSRERSLSAFRGRDSALLDCLEECIWHLAIEIGGSIEIGRRLNWVGSASRSVGRRSWASTFAGSWRCNDFRRDRIQWRIGWICRQ